MLMILLKMLALNQKRRQSYTVIVESKLLDRDKHNVGFLIEKKYNVDFVFYNFELSTLCLFFFFVANDQLYGLPSRVLVG